MNYTQSYNLIINTQYLGKKIHNSNKERKKPYMAALHGGGKGSYYNAAK